MDNGSDARTAQAVQSFLQSTPTAHRLKYRRGERVSMSRNWERALDHVEGEYIAFIGDDDGVAAHGLAAMQAAVNVMPCRLIAGAPAFFHWDDGSHLNRRRGGAMVYNWYPMIFDRTTPDVAKPWDQSNQPNRNFGIYNAFVHRSIIFDFKQKFGRYFIGTMPDVASTFINSLLQESALSLNWPIILRGYSGHSTAGKAENTAIKNIPSFLQDDAIYIDDLLAVPELGTEIPFTGYWIIQNCLEIARLAGGNLQSELVSSLVINSLYSVEAQMRSKPEHYPAGVVILRTLTERLGLQGFPIPARQAAGADPLDEPLVQSVAVRSDNVQFTVDIRPIGGRTIADAVRYLRTVVPPDPQAHRQQRPG